MKKIRIFISSRVNSSFKNLDRKFNLTDLRKYIQASLEEETVFGEKIFEVIINENSFKGDFSKNAFDNCLDVMRSCNIIVILYNGEAGWSLAGQPANGICHEEFLLAMNEFTGLTYAMDISEYFQLPEKGEEKRKNDAFAGDLTNSFRHVEKIAASTIEDLKRSVLSQIKGYILKSIEKSLEVQKLITAGASVFGKTLDWSKLSYTERQETIVSALKSSFGATTIFEEVIKEFHGLPDNMSVADARNMIGRPFVYEHKLIKGRSETSGIIHFVGVYGNATELQVKNLVGYPDLIVIKSSFGYYLWEKNAHIQIFFLTRCINPQTINTRLSQLMNWLNGSREQAKIIVRAKARFSILAAINKSQETSGLI